MGCWRAGPGYPGKVDRSANNATRREQRSGKMTKATAGRAGVQQHVPDVTASLQHLGARPSRAPLACEMVSSVMWG
jgi:hypothetical protein